ncbi:hypothetical protein U1Q18_039596, partial [Sarracenia purpurea var. burkii]
MPLRSASTFSTTAGCRLRRPLSSYNHALRLGLLQGLSVNPAVHEVEEDDESAVVIELETIVDSDDEEDDGRWQFPTCSSEGSVWRIGLNYGHSYYRRTDSYIETS